MKIYRAVKTNYLSQRFGESIACTKQDQNGNVIKPFQVVTKVGGVCPVGYTEFYPAINLKGHNGEDWGCPRGEEVRFNVDIPNMKWWGRVEVDDAQGINLDVFSLDPVPFDELPKEASEHARSYWLAQGKKIHVKFRFTHGYQTFLEDKPKIKVGILADGSPQMRPEVKLGDLICLADSTGASSGDHLHFSMKLCASNSMTVGADNGYYGAVDSTKWFENKYVMDVIAFNTKDDVQDYIDTIASLEKVAEKQTDPTIKSAFRQAVDKLLQTLASLLR